MKSIKKRSGRVLALDELVELRVADERFERMCWKCYTDLDNSRTAGLGPSPISTVDVLAWLDLHDVNDYEMRVTIYDAVLSMDRRRFKLLEDSNAKSASRDRRPQSH